LVVTGDCGNGTLDLPTQGNFINGMTYLDDMDMWVFSIEQFVSIVAPLLLRLLKSLKFKEHIV